MSTDANRDAEDHVDRAVLAALRRHADVEPFSEEDDAAFIAATVAAHLEVTQRKRTRQSIAYVITGLAAAAAAWMLFPIDIDRDTTRIDRRAWTEAAWMLEPRGTSQ